MAITEHLNRLFTTAQTRPAQSAIIAADMAFVFHRNLALPLSALALCAVALITPPPALLPSWTALVGFTLVTSTIMVAMRRLRDEQPAVKKSRCP